MVAPGCQPEPVRQLPCAAPDEVLAAPVAEGAQHERQVLRRRHRFLTAEAVAAGAVCQLVCVGVADIWRGPRLQIGERRRPRAVFRFVLLAEQADEHRDGLKARRRAVKLEFRASVGIGARPVEQPELVE